MIGTPEIGDRLRILEQHLTFAGREGELEFFGGPDKTVLVLSQLSPAPRSLVSTLLCVNPDMVEKC